MLLPLAIIILVGSQPTVVADEVDTNSMQFLSCDQCTMTNQSFWCPKDYSCYNTTIECYEACDTACWDFAQCVFGVSSCGDCVYAAGGWCSETRHCFPTASLCVASGCKSCATRDSECAECERLDAPLQCTLGLTVVVVASVAGLIFLVSLAFTIRSFFPSSGSFRHVMNESFIRR